MNKMEEFLQSFPTKKTQSSYRSHLNIFFKVNKADPNTYFKEKRDYIKDVTEYWNHNLEKAPLTAIARLSCIKLFFEENDVEIPNKIIKQLKRKRKGNKPVTLDRIPTNQELKQILSHGEAKAKALFLFASSSGMRIDEILGLETDDIEFNNDPVKVYVRAEIAKFNKPRICFISNEAKEALLEWLKVRDKYLKSAIGKTKALKEKELNDNTVFCFTYTTAEKMWNRLLRDAKLGQRDRTTGFHRLRIHTLRKFFKTRLINAGIQEAKVNMLIGQAGYLNDSYLRFTEKDLSDAYKQGVKSLLVFETPVDLTEHDERITQLEKENEQLRKDMQDTKMKLLESKVENHKDELEHLIKSILKDRNK